MKIINGIFSVLGRILGFLSIVFTSAFAGMILALCCIELDIEEFDTFRDMINAGAAFDYRLVKK